MSEHDLSPSQAADVIRYYFNAGNERFREKGWKYQFTFAQAAMQAVNPHHTLLPRPKSRAVRELVPMLSQAEKEAGLAHIMSIQNSPEYEGEVWSRAEGRKLTHVKQLDKVRDELDSSGWEPESGADHRSSRI